MKVGVHRSVVLAQAAEDLFGRLLPWLIMLLVVVVVGAAGIYLVRRMLQGGHGATGEGFTLYELRQMRAAGQLSDEEFERAKALIIGRVSEADSAPNEIGPREDDRESGG